jgi:predicted AAA+ superfamily ATPase
MLTGPRQVGKTTFLQNIAEKGRTYVTLDDPVARLQAKEDPALFFQRFHPPLLIDEIQYAPELLPHIKMEVDRNREQGLFWLTGSQHFHLMKGVSESLAGRVGVVQLLGLSRRELAGQSRESRPFCHTS